MFRLCEGKPLPALFRPVCLFRIATGFNETHEILIADKSSADLEFVDGMLFAAVFVIPAVDIIARLLAQGDSGRFYRQPFDSGRNSGIAAYRPVFGLLPIDQIQRQHSHDDRGGLQMNAFVFYTHEYQPGWAVLCDRKLDWHSLYQGDNSCLNFVSIGPYLGDAGPIVVRFIQIIPRHFVDTDSEHRLEGWVHSRVGELGQHHLVDVKSSGMTEIENKGMAQTLGTPIIGVVVQRQKQGLVLLPGSDKVVQELSALGHGIRAQKGDWARVNRRLGC